MYRVDHAFTSYEIENLWLKITSKMLHERNFVSVVARKPGFAACNDVTELKDLVPCSVIIHYRLNRILSAVGCGSISW